jgi:lipopolysaccharide heptosyltransferase II
LIAHHPAVDEAILFDRRRWVRSLGPFLRRIRLGRFDIVLDLQRIFKSGVISWYSGAPYRVGFHRSDAKEWNWIFNNHHIPATGDGIPKLEHYLKFTDYLGIKPAAIRWELRLTPQEEARVEKLLKDVGENFAVYIVGTRWESKRWFPLQAAKCADAVGQRFGLKAVLLGGREDMDFGRQVEQAYSGSLENLVGRTSLCEAAGILRRAKVAIGPDTGLMHLSAAVATPVVSLWGATSPQRTGPYGYDHLVIQGEAECSPCYLRRCPVGRVCMQSINGEAIVAQVGKALVRRTAGHGDRV